MAAYVSAYPKTFDRFLRFNNIVFNAAASEETLRLYGTIDIWIAGAFEKISSHCNQTIQATTGKVFSFDFSSLIPESTGNDYYVLPVLNVPLTITQIGYKNTVFDTIAVIPTDDYETVTVNGLQRVYFQTWSGYSLGFLTATLGYSDTNMPENIHQAAVEMCTEIYRESVIGDGRLGVSQQSQGLQNVSGSTVYYQLTARHEKLLKPYVVPILP